MTGKIVKTVRLFTREELLADASECLMLTRAVDRVREATSCVNERAQREQEDWSAVANKMVGAESEHARCSH